MKRLFIILGFIAAALTVILAVTPFSKLAFLPAAAALIFGFAAFYISKKQNSSKKSIQVIFLLTVISLCITTYKAAFDTEEVTNIEELEVKSQESDEDSKEILEGLEIDEIDLAGELEDIEFEMPVENAQSKSPNTIEEVDLGDLEIN